MEEVTLVVVQPRCRHNDGPVRTLTITVEQLREWEQNVLVPAAKRTEDPDAPLKAGEWCKMPQCKAFAVCPEHRLRLASVLPDEDFDSDIVPVPTVITPELPDPRLLPPEKVARMLEFLEFLDPFAKALRAHALDLLKRGFEVEGWKLVASKGRRKWVDESEVKGVFGMLKSEMYVVKLKSPAQIETALKAMGMTNKEIFPMINKQVTTSRGIILAREDDKREAVTPASLEFDDDDPLG